MSMRSGSYFDSSATAVDTAAIASAVDAAWAATMAAQAATARFIVENGGEFSSGHAEVSGPSGKPAEIDIVGPVVN